MDISMFSDKIVGVFVVIFCLGVGCIGSKNFIKIASLIIYFSYVLYENILPVYLICLACAFYGIVKLSFDNKNDLLKVFLILIGLIFYFYLQRHMIPGVNNVLIAKNISIGQTGFPWDLYVNYDKALMSFLALIKINGSQKREIINYKYSIIIILFSIIAVFVLSLKTEFIKYDFKMDSILWLWCINNLFMVCVAEEMFFRYFLYNVFVKINIFNKYGSLFFGLLFSSLLFGLFHYSGGVIYMNLAFLAGIIYCLLYICSGKIYISILGHFILNLMHFIFFSYPKAL